MAFKAQNVYDEVCDLLLEPGGLSLVYTQAAFLRDLNTALVEMCQDTAMAVNLLAIETPVALADITLPTSVTDVTDVLYRHRTLIPNSAFDISQQDARIDSSYDSPEEWYRSNLEVGDLRLVPAPSLTGVSTDTGPIYGFYGTISAVSGTELTVASDAPFYGVIGAISDGDTYGEVDGQMLGTLAGFATSRLNALVVANVRPISDTLALSDILTHIPDSFAIYLKWYVLRNIWSTDGESKDIARAKYAMARIEELRRIIDAVNREDLGRAA
jgi:hypothetical protein